MSADEYRSSPDDLATRPPRQDRSRRAWERILTAGVEVLETGGFGGFTVIAVCDRAGVAPRAVYERVDSKDELFAAVYEFEMRRIVADQHAVFDRPPDGPDARAAIGYAVNALLGLFASHAAFLRTVIHLAAAHPALAERGRFYTREVRSSFVTALQAAAGLDQRKPSPTVLDAAFTAVFASALVRTSYGPDYLGGSIEQAELADELTAMVAGRILT